MKNKINFRVEDLDDDVANEIFHELSKIHSLLWKTLYDTYVQEHPEAKDDEINLYVNQRIDLRQNRT